MLAILLSILSGILLSTSYIPFPPWALFFCFTPLWYVWIHRNLSVWRVFLYGWIAQFTINIIGFHWISHTAIEFGNLHEALGFLVLIAFCATQNLHIPLTGIIWLYVYKKTNFSLKNSLFFLTITTAFLERFLPKVFYWNLGYPLFWTNWPIYQWADTIGFEGLSTLVLLINGYILWIFILIKNDVLRQPSLGSPSRNLKTTFQYLISFLKDQKRAIVHIVILIVLFVFLMSQENLKRRHGISQIKH